MFETGYSSQARKFLKSAEKSMAKRILQKIEELEKEPFLHDTKVIQGYTEKLFRVRIGDYNQKGIIIVKIDKRSKVYD